jgi:hypothetical protein
MLKLYFERYVPDMRSYNTFLFSISQKATISGHDHSPAATIVL